MPLIKGLHGADIGASFDAQDERMNRIEREILRSLKRIEFLVEQLIPKQLTSLVAVIFTGDSSMTTNSLSLNVGQTSQASIVGFLADGVTPSNGVVSNAAYNFSDPSATVVLNSDGVTATVIGVAPSSAGAVTGTATCTITDTDGVVSQWSQPFTILVNAVPPPPSQLTQSVAVQFSTPTP
jgi:hypothetical protein